MSNRHKINGKGKSDKHTKSCASYRNTDRKTTNKKKKLIRQLKKQPNDLQAKTALGKLS